MMKHIRKEAKVRFGVLSDMSRVNIEQRSVDLRSARTYRLGSALDLLRRLDLKVGFAKGIRCICQSMLHTDYHVLMLPTSRDQLLLVHR